MSFRDDYLDWLVDNDICKGDEKMARLDYRSCDRCGKKYEFHKGDNLDIFTIQKRITPDGQYPVMSDPCDICTECYFDLMDFMLGKPVLALPVRKEKKNGQDSKV